MDINLLDYVPKYLLVVIIATYVLGMFLKELDSFKDKYIIAVLMAFSIVFSILVSLGQSDAVLNTNLIVNGLLMGIICWGISVGVNQTIKQLRKGSDKPIQNGKPSTSMGDAEDTTITIANHKHIDSEGRVFKEED